MERGPVAEISQAAAPIASDSTKEVIVPDVLLHLVGHDEGGSVSHDEDDPAPDDDYVIGGSGVVKALGICLQNRGNDSRGPGSEHRSQSRSGTASPRPPVHGGKAKDMSKNLLGSARKIRARLQPALVKESRAKDRVNYQRLLFLDQTLEGMINRFEDEYPETRVGPPIPIQPTSESKEDTQESPLGSLTGSVDFPNNHDGHGSDTEPAHLEVPMSDDEGETLRPALSRHNSDVSLASRALNEEEGRMHRFGQQFRREIIKPDAENATGKETEPHHIQILRAFVDGLGGEEIRDRFHTHGHEALLNDMSNEAKLLKQELKAQDPEAWEKFVEAQQAAERNRSLQVGHVHEGHAVSSSAVVD
ncbi:hypothetical protein M7I_0177 [Glarea lozoyensis 74030]|nr:hypothetical protein M7I_0177 [Glarea lozoyensis 74030]